MHLKGDVLHLLAGVDLLHAQAHVALLHLNLRELFLQLAAHHVADDLVQVGVRHVQLGHVAAVAHDRRAVADFHDLLQAVGNIDDRYAAGLQHPDRIEQRLDFTVGQRRGGLVHDQHLGVDGEGLGHLHHLLVRHAQIAHQRVRVDVHAQIVQQLLRLGEHAAPVHHEAVLHDLAAHEDVLRHGQLLGQVQLLIDGADAQPLRIVGGVDLHLLTIEVNFALILLIGAREYLHQRGLARAVFAQQRVAFALLHAQVHMIQRQYAREFFNDAAHLKKFCHGTLSHPFGLLLCN